MRVSPFPPSLQRGVGLIEVLVAVLLVALGLLGAAGMHVRSIEYTGDTERRQMASMVAVELFETMRSQTEVVLKPDGLPKDDLGGYKKTAGDALPSVEAADCAPLSAEPGKRLGCWGTRAKRLIPDLTDDLITGHFVVGKNDEGVVSVTVVWPVKKGQCLDGKDENYCTFTLQSRL